MTHTDKLLICSDAALSAKYGLDGRTRVHVAVRALIDRDAERGLRTRYVSVDDTAAMASVGHGPVTVDARRHAYKGAVDALYAALRPDYLVLLGADDVMPFQRVLCPLDDGQPGDDGYDDLLSDLPYASGTQSTQELMPAGAFVDCGRVVGRIPDLPGGRDPSHLVRLLEVARDAGSRPRQQYSAVLAISAASWQSSTEASLRASFGTASRVRLTPAEGPHWTAEDLAAPAHFINCHGRRGIARMFGDVLAGRDSVAMEGASLQTLLQTLTSPGTVVVCESCHGAALFYRAKPSTHVAVASSYLSGGAYGFFGATDTAYGSGTRSDYADLLCGYFLERVLAGASTGRAALEARHRFVSSRGKIDPVDLKTLACFALLGDPSIHPVSGGPDSDLPTVLWAEPGSKAAWVEAARRREARHARRVGAFRVGTALARQTSTSSSVPSGRSVAVVRETLDRYAVDAGLTAGVAHRFALRFSSHEWGGAFARESGGGTPVTDAVHVMTATTRGSRGQRPDHLIVADAHGDQLANVRIVDVKGP